MKYKPVKIKDIVSGFYDGPHATPEETNEGPIFLGIKNITPDGHLDLTDTKHLSEIDFAKWTKRVVPRKNDIVFSYEATLHRYAIIPNDLKCCLGRRLALIRVNEKIANYKFVYYWLLGDIWRGQVESKIISGSTVDRIPLIDFPNFVIPLPPLPLQRQIAAVLSRYDALLENYQQQVAALEALAQEVYREWFVRGRGPGVAVDAAGELPAGWRVQRLSEVLELKYGRALVAENRVEGEFPVVGSSGIVDWHDEPLVNRPGIVVGRKGNVGSIFWLTTPFYPIDTVFYIESELSPYYLFYNLQGQNFISGDSAVPGLNREQALNNKIVVPDQESLTQFDALIKAIFKKRDNLQTQMATLRATRDALLPRLLSGQLAISEPALAEA